VAGSSPVFRSVQHAVGSWQIAKQAMRFCQLQIANCQLTSRRSSGVEHFLGREGVMSSILIDGSKKLIIDNY
jgi:hypothetical protein